MSEVFPKGTKVEIGKQYTQSMETMGVVFEVQSLAEVDGVFGPKYRVTSPDGREWILSASLLERVEEPATGATLAELRDAPVGARAVTGDDRVIGKTEDGWKVIGFISKISSTGYEVASDRVALNLAPLTLIVEAE